VPAKIEYLGSIIAQFDIYLAQINLIQYASGRCQSGMMEVKRTLSIANQKYILSLQHLQLNIIVQSWMIHQKAKINRSPITEE
jgi:hypothetical protein